MSQNNTEKKSPQSSVLSPSSHVFIAGHRGMVGSAIVRLLKKKGYENIITRTSAELDLTSQQDVRRFFQNEQIDYVVLAAAKVGGIHANNTYPAEFIYKNLMIQSNVIHQAYESGVSGLLFLGSSCIYPKFAAQPMREESLLTGVLEPTNEPYAIAKIAGIKTCESYNRQYGTDYRSVMPTNLYGPGDNYHLENSHVIPAIIRKYHLAKLAAQKDLSAIEQDEKIYGPIPDAIKQALGLASLSSQSSVKSPVVQLWGTGNARREFLHVDDMASACYHIMTMDKETYDASLSTDLNSESLQSQAPSPDSQSPQSLCLSPQSQAPSPDSQGPQSLCLSPQSQAPSPDSQSPQSLCLSPQSQAPSPDSQSPQSLCLSPQSQALSPDSQSPQSQALSPNPESPQSLALSPKSSPLPSFINIGTGKDCTIREVAQIIKEIVGFDGETEYDSDQPDGTPRKLQDTTRLTHLGWHPTFDLREGIRDAYNWYCSQ